MTQIDMVRELLSNNGEVSREEAWELGIKRLGAIIYNLRDEFNIMTIERNDDTYYVLCDNEAVVYEDKPKPIKKKKKAYSFGGF